MVLRDLPVEDFCSDILRMPSEHLGLAFPAFGGESGTRQRQTVDCAAYAADYEVFNHLLLPLARTRLLPDAFNDHLYYN